MGRVIAFSELAAYLHQLKLGPKDRATILDSNVLITATYDVRDDYTGVQTVLSILAENGYRLLATVNTKAEYLEYQRRIILTETLLDAMDEYSKLKLPKRARAKISTLKGSLKTAVGSDPERDFVFGDVQLKKIKKEFSAGPHSGQLGWLELCAGFLSGRLKELEADLSDSGIEYISQHEPSQAHLFNTKIGWSDAIGISEKTGMSFSDSMIINAFQCSNCPFIVSMDFDVGYAVLADSSLKDAVMPDRLVAEYRHYHFK